jgi:CRP/FNR family cyclic AMP-dependent transcriptional regulator
MDDILALCAGLPEREFAAGVDLLSQGSRSGRIFVLTQGAVGIEVGGVLIKQVSEAGAFLGEISALLGTTHSARVFALEPTRAHEFAAEEITSNPALLLGMARLLAARLNAMTGYLVDLRRQYADDPGHLGLMAEVLSELTAARPVVIAPGSAREDVPDY